jgi:hypothetical protein
MSASATGWRALAQELDACEAAGMQATLWWRDDDACADSPALRRMLDIAEAQRTPLAIAVIPAGLESSLVDAIGRYALPTVVQHGYAHRNHAPAGERSAELSGNRALDECIGELTRGRDALLHAFGERYAPILVPPWNRIAAGVVPHLPAAGFRGLSRFGSREAAPPGSRLTQVNAHVDLIAWRRGRVFIGPDAAIERLIAHLRARRRGEADAGEPTGVLTHHLVTTDDAWQFVVELLARTREHRAARWLDVRGAFDVATCVRSA